VFTSDKSNKKKESTLKESSGFLNLSFVTAMLHNNAAMTDTDFEHRIGSELPKLFSHRIVLPRFSR